MREGPGRIGRPRDLRRRQSTDRKMRVCKLAVNLLTQVYLLILNHLLLYLTGENAKNAFKSRLKETIFNNVLLSLS